MKIGNEKIAHLSSIISDCFRKTWRPGAALALILALAILALPGPASSLGTINGQTAKPISVDYKAIPEAMSAEGSMDALYWGRKVAALNPSLTSLQMREIGNAVMRYSEEYGLSPRLIVAVIRVESTGRVHAESSRGAQGLMQVMPFWKDEFGIEGSLFEIDTNIMAGTRILSGYIKRHGQEEGIARYYRGTLPVDAGAYYRKIQNSMPA